MGLGECVISHDEVLLPARGVYKLLLQPRPVRMNIKLLNPLESHDLKLIHMIIHIPFEVNVNYDRMTLAWHY